jgi:hypothetical protein
LDAIGAILPAMEPLLTLAALLAGTSGVGWLAVRRRSGSRVWPAATGSCRSAARRAEPMWFLFPRARDDRPLSRLLRVLRDLVRARKHWPLPKAHVPKPEPRRQAAEAVGLAAIGGEDPVAGRSGDLEVSLRDRPGAAGTLVEIRGVIPGLLLQGEGLDSAFKKRMGVPELEIGDEEFDRALFVQSHGPELRALLEADLRRRLLRAFQGRLRDDSRWAQAPPAVDRFRIEDGTLTAELHDTSAPGADPLDVSLAALIGAPALPARARP